MLLAMVTKASGISYASCEGMLYNATLKYEVI